MSTLGEVMVTRGGTVAPSAFPEEEFELYSIPAHDRGGPEIALGSSIGSAKQIVQPGDVMISKIIPHIRRSRIVEPFSGRRQIASGEWIVFRGGSFHPNYLRQFLLSDEFHRQFMNTVAGVGGSLVRARPAQARAIDLPLPSLPEQRRIAAILDRADAIRAKRRQALAHLDSLIGATFHEIFGDFSGTRRVELSELASVVTKGTTPTTLGLKFAKSGIPFLRVQNLQAGTVAFGHDALFIDAATDQELRRSRVHPRDLLISIAGTIGRVALVPPDSPRMNCNQAVAIVRLRQPETGAWLRAWFSSRDALRQLGASAVTATISNLSLGQIRQLKLPAVERPEIDRFTGYLATIDGTRSKLERAVAADDELFASLQSRAFRGEL